MDSPERPAGAVAGDAIRITGLRLAGIHGVHPEERIRPQPFVVDAVLWLDLRRAAGTDALDDTFDYGRVARIAAEVVAGPPRNLIESLAGEIADRLLAARRDLLQVLVRVHKPHAPVGLPFDDISAEVVRRPRP